jgi:hypothetical protein
VQTDRLRGGLPRGLFPRGPEHAGDRSRCPVEAIYSEDELPEGQEQFLQLNADLSRSWPVITEMQDPPADADDWREVKDKLQYLER